MSTKENDRAQLITFLQKKTYVTDITLIGLDTLSFKLKLQKGAIDVFIHSLGAQIKKNLYGQVKSENFTLILKLDGYQIESLKTEFDYAFNRVFQYLDYVEISKDYAAGLAPKYLSGWLLYQN